MAGPPSGSAIGGSAGVGSLQGSGSWEWCLGSCSWESWLISRFSFELEYTEPDREQVENNVRDFQIINGPSVTMAMCEQGGKASKKLYADEMFQPLYPNTPSLEHHQSHEDVE